MAKEKKQFRELSDEELEKVNGGILPLRTVDCPNINPFCMNRTMNERGCEICIS